MDTVMTPNHLLSQLESLRNAVVNEAENRYAHWKTAIVPQREFVHQSARNLATYLALRHHDLRELQRLLRPWGLSSLGRSEAQTLPTLDALIATVAQLAGKSEGDYPRPTAKDFQRGECLLIQETERVLGMPHTDRTVRLMVTLPSEAATNPLLVRQLLQHGMEIARINCAHDGVKQWEAMVAHVRAAEEMTGLSCKIAMDLGGPKCRTADVSLPKKHRIQRGDRILLRVDAPRQRKHFPLQVRCTLPQAVEQIKLGERVYFDDGKIGATMIERVQQGVVLAVTQASLVGDRLKDDKGINFPDTALHLSPLTEKDLQDLPSIVQLANILNYSFVQSADDVRLLQAEIEKVNGDKRSLAIIAKIETSQAFRQLPDIIMAITSKQPCGVMIARGDLAVELGFERMAELQEEILWVCEAAHVPVVWATQVLETLAKEGRATRAEMTDAAMSQRAEAVMLNKGAYILDAMDVLDGVLRRMATHQHKKTAQLRPLSSF
jgi:pyruvate kinase